MTFVRTQAINKLKKLNKRIKVIPGGTSAGKTFGILPILIDKAIKTPLLEISIVAESVPHLRRGAMKDFLKILQFTNRFDDKKWNKTNLKYTFGNGSYIEFFSTDQPDRLRGARRDILFINEANNVHWDAYLQLSIRTSQEVWIDFNPSNEFWAHEELLQDEDAEWLTLTYKDNVYKGKSILNKAIVKEIEKGLIKGFHNIKAEPLFVDNNIKSRYWSNWWKVYGLGLLGVLEGVVFSDWSIVDEIPEKAKYIGTGIDFGYTNHPTAIIDCWELDGKYIWDERTYLTGLKNNNIAEILKYHGRLSSDYIYADSAEPKSIDEINAYGFSIEGVEKGADSINFGISILQQEHFQVTKRSVNLINELRRYCWDTDKTGKALNKPIKAFDHAIDAMRYFAMMKFPNKNYTDPTEADMAYEKALELLS